MDRQQSLVAGGATETSAGHSGITHGTPSIHATTNPPSLATSVAPPARSRRRSFFAVSLERGLAAANDSRDRRLTAADPFSPFAMSSTTSGWNNSIDDECGGASTSVSFESSLLNAGLVRSQIVGTPFSAYEVLRWCCAMPSTTSPPPAAAAPAAAAAAVATENEPVSDGENAAAANCAASPKPSTTRAGQDNDDDDGPAAAGRSLTSMRPSLAVDLLAAPGADDITVDPPTNKAADTPSGGLRSFANAVQQRHQQQQVKGSGPVPDSGGNSSACSPDSFKVVESREDLTAAGSAPTTGDQSALNLTAFPEFEGSVDGSRSGGASTVPEGHPHVAGQANDEQPRPTSGHTAVGDQTNATAASKAAAPAGHGPAAPVFASLSKLLSYGERAGMRSALAGMRQQRRVTGVDGEVLKVQESRAAFDNVDAVDIAAAAAEQPPIPSPYDATLDGNDPRSRGNHDHGSRDGNNVMLPASPTKKTESQRDDHLRSGEPEHDPAAASLRSSRAVKLPQSVRQFRTAQAALRAASKFRALKPSEARKAAAELRVLRTALKNDALLRVANDVAFRAVRYDRASRVAIARRASSAAHGRVVQLRSSARAAASVAVTGAAGSSAAVSTASPPHAHATGANSSPLSEPLSSPAVDLGGTTGNAGSSMRGVFAAMQNLDGTAVWNDTFASGTPSQLVLLAAAATNASTPEATTTTPHDDTETTSAPALSAMASLGVPHASTTELGFMRSLRESTLLNDGQGSDQPLFMLAPHHHQPSAPASSPTGGQNQNGHPASTASSPGHPRAATPQPGLHTVDPLQQSGSTLGRPPLGHSQRGRGGGGRRASRSPNASQRSPGSHEGSVLLHRQPSSEVVTVAALTLGATITASSTREHFGSSGLFTDSGLSTPTRFASTHKTGAVGWSYAHACEAMPGVSAIRSVRAELQRYDGVQDRYLQIVNQTHASTSIGSRLATPGGGGRPSSSSSRFGGGGARPDDSPVNSHASSESAETQRQRLVSSLCIDLSATYCGINGVLPVIAALHAAPQLRRLNLSGCGIDDAAVMALCETLQEDCPWLSHLDVSNNKRIGLASGTHLHALTHMRPRLVSLNTDGTNIRKATQRSIARRCETNEQRLNVRAAEVKQRSLAARRIEVAMANVAAADQHKHNAAAGSSTTSTSSSGSSSDDDHEQPNTIVVVEPTLDATV